MEWPLGSSGFLVLSLTSKKPLLSVLLADCAMHREALADWHMSPTLNSSTVRRAIRNITHIKVHAFTHTCLCRSMQGGHGAHTSFTHKSEVAFFWGKATGQGFCAMRATSEISFRKTVTTSGSHTESQNSQICMTYPVCPGNSVCYFREEGNSALIGALLELLGMTSEHWDFCHVWNMRRNYIKRPNQELFSPNWCVAICLSFQDSQHYFPHRKGIWTGNI